jgi:alanyl-tRNA synthetase
LKITGEGSVAAGIRRVEAVVGAQGIHYLKRLEGEIDRLAAMLKANPHDVVDRVEKLLDHVKRLEKDLQKAKTRGAEGGGEQEEIKEVKGVKVLTSIVAIDDPKLLRDLSDQKIQKLGSGILALGAANGDKVTLIIRVSKDLTSKYHAGNLLKEIAPIVGGTGGGRPDMAQGGGSKPESLNEALQRILSLI